MITIERIAEMQAMARQWKQQAQSLGFVPTMGYLHEGHLSLIRIARRHCRRVVVSIFVNPTQFAPNEDLTSYPRDFQRDAQLCADEGVDVIFAPGAAEMYAPDFSTWIDESALTTNLCGSSRPGHFRGVATVVGKLFNAVLPDLAVFGQKDAQQAMLIKRLVRDLNMPIELIIAPIVRDADGLALSSRNKYLSASARTRALAISAGLRAAAEAFADGQRTAAVLEAIVFSAITANQGRIDYVQIVAQSTLQPLPEINEPALLAVAAVFDSTRLIDNCLLNV